MQTENRTDFNQRQISPMAAAHMGAAVVALRRRAQDQISGLHTRRLLALADGLEMLLPAVERLEMASGVRL